MKEFRKGKNCTEYYTSFDELREGFNLKPIVKRTKDEEKLKGQRQRFMDRHKCKACNQPMSYVGGTVMTCINEKCKGIKEKRFTTIHLLCC